MASPPRVFISYCHQDEAWKDRLVKQLRVLELEERLSLWEDRRIVAGDDWRGEIEEALATADAAVLLVTADFLTSPFIRDEEVPRLLARRSSEGVRVMPLIVKPCPWDLVDWLAALLCRPQDGKPLSTMRTAQADEALTALAREIDDLLKQPPPTGSKSHASPPPARSSSAGLPSSSASTPRGRLTTSTCSRSSPGAASARRR